MSAIDLRSGLPAQSSTGWDLVENADGQTEWVEKVVKVNPYGARKQKNLRDRKADEARRVVWQKKAPDEKGYTWSMGYRQCSGRFTQGNLFPEISGSSLNRKKNAKVIPSSDGDIIRMADTAAVKYHLLNGHPIVEWDGKRQYFAALAETVRAKLIQGDREFAVRLALWLSASVRKLSRSVSYGVHLLSARSRGKIRDKATAFFRSCPGDRIFGTFTFISEVDDQTGVSILNKFLTQARKKFPTLQYFWVAERQKGDRNDGRGVEREPTGNIHFHMILNKRLDIGRWNALWVLSQYNAGLRGHDQFGREISLETLQDLYRLDQKEGFCGARSKDGRKKISRIQAVLNPLDIKKVRDISKLSSYLTKYITKQEINEPYGCAAWHCSRRVSRMFTRQAVGPSAFAYMKSFENWGIDKTTGELWGKPQEYRPCAFAVVVPALNKAAPLRYLRRMEEINKWVLAGHEIEIPKLSDERYIETYILPPKRKRVELPNGDHCKN